MFGRTLIARAISSYALFVREAYQNPEMVQQLNKLTIIKRAKLLGRLFRGLSKPDLAKLKAKAAKTPMGPKRKRIPHKPHAYATFTREHFGDAEFAGLDSKEKLRRIAALWKQK